MGVYDTVHITCPHCNGRTKIQSKSAYQARLRNYRATAVPVDVAAGALGEDRCDNCAQKFVVKARTPRIELYAEVPEKEDSEEDDDEHYD